MMTSGPISPQLQLPLLAAGQAHKDVTHNEALLLLDVLLVGVVQGVANDAPPAPVPGHMWIIGSSPTGIWQGMAHSLAISTAGGWRFVAPPPDYCVRAKPAGTIMRRSAGGWTAAITVAAPTGGGVVDAECRTALAMLRQAMLTAGLIAA